ncbi:C39 family peptidase [Thermococcus sp.]
MRWKPMLAVLLGLLMVGVTPVTATAFPQDAPIMSAEIAPQIAEKIALTYVEWISKNIPLYKEWKGSNISKTPRIYYLPNGSKVAYEFTVLKNDRVVGYMMISARKDLPPVLEFGKSKPPSINIGKVNAKYNVKRLLYLGALLYVADIGKGKAVHLRDMGLMEYPQRVEFNVNHKAAEALWDDILRDTYNTLFSESNVGIESSTPVLIDWAHIDGVPSWTSEDTGNSNIKYPNNIGIQPDPWDTWDGCTPIAASMVLGYYVSFPDKESIIDVLHHTMDTDDIEGTTYYWNIDDGIDNFAEEYTNTVYYPVFGEKYPDDFDGSNDYYVSTSEVKREITNNRPFVLSIQGGHYGLTTGHSVAVVGFTEWQNPEDHNTWMYLTIHNTWYNGDEGVDTILFGDWSVAVATYVSVR